MKRLLFLLLLVSSFAHGQRYFNVKNTLSASTSFQQMLASDVPSNFLRSGSTNTFTAGTTTTFAVPDASLFNMTVTGDASINLGTQLSLAVGQLTIRDANLTETIAITPEGDAGTIGDVLTNLGSGVTGWAAPASSGGTVTSVALALPTSIFDISGSPVTTTGTLTATLDNQGPFTSLFSPIPQSFNYSSTPTFRQMKNLDLPAGNRYKLKLTGIPFIYGDSFAANVGASPGTFGWVEQFKAANGNITINNQAVTARGINVAALASYSQGPQFLNGNAQILMVGLNDIGRGGGASSTLNKILNGNRAIIVNAWLKFAIAASAVTNTGTWSNYTAQTLKASNLGGNTRQSSTSGDALSYTTTEASDNIVIGTIGTDGSTYNYGPFTITIDGVSMGTYDPDGQADNVSDGATDNGRTPNVLVFNGLRNSVHAITLTLTTSTTTVIDYIGYMNKPEDCPGVIVSSIPRRNATGYATGSATDPITTATNTAIEADLEANFLSPFRPVTFIYQDRSYDTANDLDPDGTHPDNSGHTHLFQNIQNAVDENETIQSLVRYAPHTTAGPSAHFSNAGMGFSMFHNTNPLTNGIVDATAGTVIQQSNVTSGNVGVSYFMGAAGASPTLKIKIDNTGKFVWSNSTDGTMLDFASGSISHVAAGNMEVLSGASRASSTYTAKLTAASIMNVSPTSGIVVFSNPSGLTIGNTFAPTEIARIGSTITRFTGNMFVGNSSSSPTAVVHIKAGTTAASTAPLKFTSGSLNTTAEVGAVEFLTDKYYGTITTGAARKELTLNDAALTSGRVPIVTTNGRLTDVSTFLFGSSNLTTPGLTTGYVAKTGAYTLTSADYTVEVTSGTHNQTLPTAVGIAGKIFVITNSGAGVVTVDTTSSQTFVNVAITPTTLTLNQYQTVVVQSNGANWLRLSTL